MDLGFSKQVAIFCIFGALASTAFAQAREPRRRREPTAIPSDASIQWTVFISAFGEVPPRRMAVGAEPAALDVPIEGWHCTYSAPNRAQLNGTNWSEMRTLECAHGNAVVSTTGFCQIAGASWGARAAVLSLGAATADGRATVTLDCAVN